MTVKINAAGNLRNHPAARCELKVNPVTVLLLPSFQVFVKAVSWIIASTVTFPNSRPANFSANVTLQGNFGPSNILLTDFVASE
jgi:hypothetical protein